MTLNELIDLVRRQRAAYPELADAPVFMLEASYENGECTGEQMREIIDVRAHVQGVAIASILFRTSPTPPACGDEFLAEYEQRMNASKSDRT